MRANFHFEFLKFTHFWHIVIIYDFLHPKWTNFSLNESTNSYKTLSKQILAVIHIVCIFKAQSDISFSIIHKWKFRRHIQKSWKSAFKQFVKSQNVKFAHPTELTPINFLKFTQFLHIFTLFSVKSEHYFFREISWINALFWCSHSCYAHFKAQSCVIFSILHKWKFKGHEEKGWK